MPKKATIKKTLPLKVIDPRETENGTKHRLIFGVNEISDDGVKTLLKFEFMDSIPAKWKALLEGVEINDTLLLTIESGTTQEKL